jgi:hypothetical protein
MKIYDFNGKKNISGERIREARIKMHLSQKALAVRLKLEGVELERDCIFALYFLRVSGAALCCFHYAHCLCRFNKSWQ